MDRATSASGAKPFSFNGTPMSAIQSTSINFTSPNFTMSPQGRFVQRLTQVETENKLLRAELDELQKWKTGLESWLMDAFGLVRSDLKVDDVESVGSNDSRETNTRSIDEVMSGSNFGAVKMEVEDTGMAGSAITDSSTTQPIIQNLPPPVESRNPRNITDNGQDNAASADKQNSTKEFSDSTLQTYNNSPDETSSASSSSPPKLSKTPPRSTGNSLERKVARSPTPTTGRSSDQVRRLSSPFPLPSPVLHNKEKALAANKPHLVPLRRRIVPRRVDKTVDVTIDDETVSTSNELEPPVEDIDPTPCDICRGHLPEAQNNMIYCEKCNICVHQACYGVPEIPEGEWLCQPCAANIPVAEQTCRFCTIKGGAMVRVKSPKNNTWAHVSCCWWIPGVHIHNPSIMDIVVGTPNIEKERYQLRCSVCRQGRGTTCCIQCRFRRCATAFHVTCAFKAGLRMEMVDDDEAPDGVLLISFCNAHRDTDLATIQTPNKSPKKRKTESRVSVSKTN